MRRLFAFAFVFFIFQETNAQCPEGSICSHKNLVINGDFSMGDQSFISAYTSTNRANSVVFNPNSYEESVMMSEAHYSVVNNPNDIHDHFSNCKDRSGAGNMMVVNGSYRVGELVWQQKIEVKQQTTYLFSCWLSSAHPASPAQLKFSINGELLGNPILASNYTCDWKQFYTTWESGDLTEITISIVNQNTARGGNDFILDDITFYECISPDFESQIEEAKLGEVIELREIFFDSGKSELREESNKQLDRMVAYLNENPTMEIEILGHTDNIGAVDDNLELSKNRASSVVNYLKNKGVREERLKFIGYGESQPIGSNETYEGRQLNRRVEFKIVKM
jgi:outer membrane protein OmpA-like peptidoglycan-associated protein